MLHRSAEHRRHHVPKSVRQHHCLMPRNYGIFFSLSFSHYHYLTTPPSLPLCLFFPVTAGTVRFKARASGG